MSGRWGGRAADAADPQPLATAFLAGASAFRAGQPETANPYGMPASKSKAPTSTDWHNNPTDAELSHEWGRGYRNTRGSAKFRATIVARQK